MKDDKKTVEEALNDIFDGDFIEVDSKNKKEDKDIKKESTNEKASIFDEVKFEDDTSYNKPIDDNLVYHEYDNKVSEINNEETKKEQNTSDNKIPEDEENNSTLKNEVKEDLTKENKKTKKKLFIILYLVGILIGIFLIIIIFLYLSNKKHVLKCDLNIKDTGYKVTDTYLIAYQKDNILYLNSDYNYKALNDEYKKQIEFIKQEKIPVMINSNSMSGFTYIYESGEDYFNIKGSLDFTKFNYKEINKINQKTNPISYFTIKKGMKLDDIKKKLEKDGYKCIKNK